MQCWYCQINHHPVEGIGFPLTLGEMIYPVDSTIVSVKSKLQHTRAYPRHLRPSSRGWRIWSPCTRVGNLNHSLDSVCRLYYCLWDELDMLWNDFRGIERLWLCGQSATNKYNFIQCYCCIFKFCICQFICTNTLVLSLLQ